MKTCTSCGKEKPLSDYPRKGGTKLRGYCKECYRAKKRDKYAANVSGYGDKKRAKRRARKKKECNELMENYIMKLIFSRSTLKEIPKELIECKRLQIMIKRELKKEMTK